MAGYVEHPHCVYNEDFDRLKNDIYNENFTKNLARFVVEFENPLENAHFEDIKQMNLKDCMQEDIFLKEGKKPSVALIAKRINESLRDVYVNVICNDQIPQYYFGNNVWHIPHVIMAMGDEIGKYFHCSEFNVSKSIINMVDIIVNPLCIKPVRCNRNIYNAFVNFVKSTMKIYLEVEVKTVELLGFDVYINDPIMSSSEAMSMVKEGLRNLNIMEGMHNATNSDIDLKENNFDRYIHTNEPSYKIKYLNYNDFETINDRDIERPNMVTLEFFLPGVDCIEDIDIETDGREIKLRTKNDLALEIKIDFPVQEMPVKSTFFKDLNILNLEFKVNNATFKKINLCGTTIQTVTEECETDKDPILPVKDNDKAVFILPEYKITQSMFDYTLIILCNSMVKGSLKHIYVGNDVLEVSFIKNVESSSPVNSRIIFDVSPRKLNCAKSFLNTTKKSLKFTIKKVTPKISIKAKIGSSYDCLEEVKVLYFEKKYSNKMGKQSDWIKECPERTRSLSESSVSAQDQNTSGTKRRRQNSFSNGSSRSRKKSEFFLTSSWPKGILKRCHSYSESAGSSSQEVFEEDLFDSKQSLESSNSLYKSCSSDSVSYLSEMGSSLDDLSMASSPQNPQKKVLFSDVISKSVYKPSASIVSTKNRDEYTKRRQDLIKKAKKENCDIQQELKDLIQSYKDNNVGDKYKDLLANNVNSGKPKKKKSKKRKDYLNRADKEELIFSLEDDN